MVERIRWSDAPCVFIPIVKPACPACGCERFLHVRGEANGDGSTTERVFCERCSERYKIIREPVSPEPGIFNDLDL
jgi:hypothetical protein